jgi:hypothetical protein
MRPLHPCPLCGHEFVEECRAVASDLPGHARVRCSQCRDDCIPIVRPEDVPDRLGDRGTRPGTAIRGLEP